jgi:hypothetical protein
LPTAATKKEIDDLKFTLASAQEENQKLRRAVEAEVERLENIHTAQIALIKKKHAEEIQELSATNDNLRTELLNREADLDIIKHLKKENRHLQRELRLWRQRDEKLRILHVELQQKTNQLARLNRKSVP